MKISATQTFPAILYVVIILLGCSAAAQVAVVSTIGSVSGSPSGIAVDVSGNIYIAERAPASRITKFNPTTQTYSTLANMGTADILDLTFGPDGNLYASDYSGGKISKISLAGSVTNYVTGISTPSGMCWSSDTLYFFEYVGQRLYKVLPGGGAMGSANVVLLKDSYWMSPNTGVRGLALGNISGNRLVATCGGCSVVYGVEKTSGVVDTLTYSGNGHFDMVYRNDDQRFYLTMNNENKIYYMGSTNYDMNEFAGNGIAMTSDGIVDSTVAFDSPYYIAADANEDLYITDYNSGNIRKIAFDQPVGIYDSQKDVNLLVYPNPFSNQIKLEADKETVIHLLDATGSLVEVKVLISGINELNLQHLPEGFYMIHAGSGKSLTIIKQ